MSFESTNRETPLIIAARAAHARIVQVLLNRGASADERQWYLMKPLHFASTPDVVKVLVENGALVNETGGNSETPLFHAAEERHVDVVRATIELGASVDAVNEASATLLLCAAKTGRVDVVKVLLGEDADVNHKDRDDKTALIMAAKQGHLNAVRLLIERGRRWMLWPTEGRLRCSRL